MLKKTLYSLIAIVFIGIIAWEYKVNILIWSIPKVTSILMPIQENIPTTWSEGPSVDSEDERPNIILILADDMGLGKTLQALSFLALLKFSDKFNRLLDGIHPTLRHVPPSTVLFSSGFISCKNDLRF